MDEFPADKRAGQALARPQVVILGAGFGGLSAATALRHAPVDITLIDRRNYHLFQPLLYQVATAGLSPAQIASPIRRIVSRQKNVTVLMDKIVAIDKSASEVVTSKRRIHFDYLIVATGARHAYFGHEQWEEFAPGLKKIDEATEIRRRILLAFEQAEATVDENERRRSLTFVVVGGGPTGVEMAGAIAELAHRTIVHDFRHINPTQTQIILVEAGSRILPAFPDKLSESAARQLSRLGVTVMTEAAVTDCGNDGITLRDGRRIETATIIWAAGVMASPAGKWLEAQCDRAGRVVVDATLRLPGSDNTFVIGDTAIVTDVNGITVPGIAPAAKQMGYFAAGSILGDLKGSPRRKFKYRNYGNLATFGRSSAVADFGGFTLSGFPAWLIWCFAHIWFLIGFRNRLVVFLDWIVAYVSFNRGVRLITGGEN
ncbi:NAD(P)/FAD-dependent oxidoreductase [Nordella sp. HKS 07]|uniref:NAD(P)/FAD-dependent oxidoreductase n=1 Tax=Nordella sp. HKS 07 TaxID=2712222 RepID=UPI0013E14116|nr:NAD(P)/FAD-dependent oxidoreductase [Nordella sp. HKS 07]QIG51516.1 NAD(P)/FAD-dependent oxidoreductase [Nordella sp. HKS 07]